MLLAVEYGTLLGGFGTALAAVVGVFAFLQKRRTDREQAAITAKAMTRDEVQQAFDLQERAMAELVASNQRLTAEITRVRDKNDDMHGSLNSALAELNIVKGEHRKCERDLNALGDELRSTVGRLHIAEARIAELGG